MPTGSVFVDLTPSQAVEKLKPILAAANCTIREIGEHRVTFSHGTYLTQSAPLMIKHCTLTLSPTFGHTSIRYEVHVAFPLAAYLTLFAVVFCWTIYMPVVVYRSLVVHPRLFVRNLLAGL